jgi:hypothetical protein
VSGKVNSSSTTPGKTGGRVNVLGDKVAVIGGNIEASGTNGGGTVLIGGDYQGKGTVPNASRTFVSQDSLLNADAITDGNGGQVIIWSEQASAFYGNISAQGGSNSGNGGFVEVSGKGNLQFAGTVTTQAATGVPGTLLLDPKDILIQARGADPVTGNSFFSDNPIAISRISGANLTAAIDAANVTLQANNDIIVDDDITATTVGNGLTLQAGRFITFNGDRTISLNGGNFSARINDENANPANRDPGTAQLGMNPGSQILTNGGSVTIELFTQPEQLQLILVTSKGKPLLKTVYQADRATLLKMALQFRSQVTETRKKTGYQATAKQLYQYGEFNLGAPRNSYIQLWDSKLRLDQLRQLGWSNPPVELLVLSACRTAVGNEEAELGFGGLAVAAGVKSAVASLWYVSDEGTLGLMSEFYQQLKTAPMKAEALRQAQIAMIKGQVRFEGGQLLTTGSRGAVPLPPELAQGGEKNLSHPAYWAAFTMIGSPW